MTMHDPFFVELNEGLKKAVQAQGDRYLFLDGMHSRENQEQNTIRSAATQASGAVPDAGNGRGKPVPTKN
jgi:hypothetical protein